MIELEEDLRIKQIEGGFVIDSHIGCKFIESVDELKQAIQIFFEK